jgi:hypothetical protein
MTQWRGNLEVIEQGSKIKAISRLWLCRLLVCFGLAVGTLSVWDTLSHTWDPAFQAPALPLGPTHTNYHAFREFTLSVGAMLVLAYGMFLPLAKRSRDLWNVMCVTAFCYYGGWWIPSPLFGLQAPNTLATIIHLASTVLTLTGVTASRGNFPNSDGAAR